MEELRVESYAGYKGEETPRAFTHEGMRREISKIISRWYTENHAYFRVQTQDGYIYVLRYELEQFEWEMVMAESRTED